MKKQIGLLLLLEESEIDALEKLPKEQLQEVQAQAANSVRKGLIKLGLIEEKRFIKIEESQQEQEETVSFVIGAD